MKAREFSRAAATLCLLAAFATTPAFAVSVSYYLDQSNINASPYQDGQNFLQVTISDGVGGAIDFLVQTLGPLTSHAGTKYGIDSFGFNTTLGSVTTANITGLPSNWNAGAGANQDGFGNFQFVVNTNGANNVVDPLSFSITGIAGDTPMDYVALSGGNAGEGNTDFAAHVINLSTQVTSGYFAGSAPVPETDTWGMMVVGLGLVGLRLRRRLKGVRRIRA